MLALISSNSAPGTQPSLTANTYSSTQLTFHPPVSEDKACFFQTKIKPLHLFALDFTLISLSPLIHP